MWRPMRPTVVYVGEVAFGLTLIELSQSVEVTYKNSKWVPVSGVPVRKGRGARAYDDWTTWHDLPSGRLVLAAYLLYAGSYWRREWQEDKPGDLSGKVKTITRALKREAPAVVKAVAEAKHQREVAHKQWEAQQAEWRRQEAERRRIELDKRSREELLAIVDSWARAKRIEEFFGDAEERAAQMEDADRGVALERVKRARRLLGSVDALRRLDSWNSPHEWRAGVGRETDGDT